MAIQGTPLVPLGDADGLADVAVQRPWRMRGAMSRIADLLEALLGRSGFDRGPWLVVAFATGIGAWFLLAERWQWIAAMGIGLLVATFAFSAWRTNDARAHLRLAGSAIGLAFACGIAVVWLRSEVVGAEPLDRPTLMRMDAQILERVEQPSESRVRLVVATRDSKAGKAIKLRINVPEDKDMSGLAEGAVVRLRARLMPPSAPLLPGAYDFARRSWFDGYAATGSLVGDIRLLEPADVTDGRIASAQRKLSRHVQEHMPGPPGSIAAAFASGDRGAIAQRDASAMRDAGLTHLLAISGLHVSAVIAAAYFVALKLLALWPWLTLRIRLPLVTASIAALAGIGYTLLTGAQVPTVRSCVGAVLVLVALAMGREPLSLRMVAVAAGVILLMWPETLVGPSFQMSFAAVLAIVALHGSQPVRAFLSPREERCPRWFGRRVVMLFVTGLVIELALMPIVLFHFHRAGLYGALANVFAIPLVTFISMPLIAFALVLDLVGLGAPFWWLASQSLDLLLWIAHTTADQPGAVKLFPKIGLGTVTVFVGGALWLALWKGRGRLLGLAPIAVACLLMAITPTPDVLIARDGRDVGLVNEGGQLFVLRDNPESYAGQNLLELAGTQAAPIGIANWPSALCSADFCSIPIERREKTWHLLVARSRERIDERSLAAACEKADIVIASRWLPRSCMPRWLKADGKFLAREGGTSIYLSKGQVDTVGSAQGDHGWWRGESQY